jgi:3-hydroxyisobutyrate dehydrogenase-like beta-hydroxyacid dehydrogenase
MRVALLGTGKMGAAIARRIAQDGHDLTLWNRTRERAEAVGVGRVADSPEAAADGAEIVLTIVFDAPAVRELYARLRPAAGQVLVEMSTAGPGVLEDVAPAVEAAGASLLACPIVGSVPAIEDGSAVLLAGGDAAALERARGVLGSFGRPEHVGTRTEAASLKLITNAMLGAVNVAAAELLSAADAAAVPKESAFWLLCRLVPYLTVRRRGLLDHDHDNPLFELRGIRKDLDLMLQMGHDAGAALPVAGLARELYGAAEPAWGGKEMTAVIERYGAGLTAPER